MMTDLFVLSRSGRNRIIVESECSNRKKQDDGPRLLTHLLSSGSITMPLSWRSLKNFCVHSSC